MIGPDDKVIPGSIEIVDSHTVRLNLPNADVSLVPGMCDYPAQIAHKDYDFENIGLTPLGTGPYKLESPIEVGVRAVLVRNTDHEWWNAGNGAYMDRFEFIDYGTEPTAWLAAAESDEVDFIDRNEGEYIDYLLKLMVG